MATTTLSPEELAHDIGPQQNAVTTAFLVLATLFVGLRFWARWIVRAGFGADDWATVASLAVTIVLGFLNHAMVKQGMGRHFKTLSGEQQAEFFKLMVIFGCFYVTGAMLAKLAVLLMLRRLFPSPGFKRWVWGLGSLTMVWWVSMGTISVCRCNPVVKTWEPATPGTCLDIKVAFIGNAIPNILIDVAILCLPIYQVWRLKLSLAQRLSVCLMFMLGGFVLFASIYRFTTIMKFDEADVTWTLAWPCTWSVIETACGVISACLPMLRPLIAKVLSPFGSVTSRLSSSGLKNKSKTGGGGGGGTSSLPFDTKSARDIVGSGAAKSNFTRLDDGSDVEMELGVSAKATAAAAAAKTLGKKEADAEEVHLAVETAPAGGIRVYRDVKVSRRKF